MYNAATRRMVCAVASLSISLAHTHTHTHMQVPDSSLCCWLVPRLYIEFAKSIVQKRRDLSIPIISWKKFCKWAKALGIDESRVLHIAQVLSDWGIILYLASDDAMASVGEASYVANYVLLDPHYMSLLLAHTTSTKRIKSKNGVLLRSVLESTWSTNLGLSQKQQQFLMCLLMMRHVILPLPEFRLHEQRVYIRASVRYERIYNREHSESNLLLRTRASSCVGMTPSDMTADEALSLALSHDAAVAADRPAKPGSKLAKRLLNAANFASATSSSISKSLESSSSRDNDLSRSYCAPSLSSSSGSDASNSNSSSSSSSISIANSSSTSLTSTSSTSATLAATTLAKEQYSDQHQQQAAQLYQVLIPRLLTVRRPSELSHSTYRPGMISRLYVLPFIPEGFFDRLIIRCLQVCAVSQRERERE
jgi:hypothetical protein